MAHLAKKAGPFKTVFALLLLFGPASLLIFISTRGCKHKFKQLDDYGMLSAYEFKTIDNETITPKSFKDEIVIFTTIQETCPKKCGIDLWQLDQQIYQNLRENPKKLGHVKLVSIVTDGNGKPVSDVSNVVELLEHQIDGFDPKIWKVVSGDPKAVFDITHNNQNLMQKGKEYFGGEAFQELLLLSDKKNHCRMVLSGKTEGMVRTMKDHLALLEKQYDLEKATNGK